MSKIKIEIKNRWTGNVLFEYEKENNTLKETLEKAITEGADLRGAYLRGADLRGACLEGAYLRGADLRGACLEGADLRGADLRGAYLRGADLRGACLEGAYLRGAYLRGANLEGAYLRGACLYVSDDELNIKEIIENIENNSDLKIKKYYINKHILSPYYLTYWKNGLIIDDYEIVEPEKEVKEMTIEQISKELGYEIKIVRESKDNE